MTGTRAIRPNVIVFFTDQQRWDTTGLHHNPLGLTPNLDQAARSGTHVYHSFTCQPVCAPSRAALQTGRYPTTIGVHRNGLPLPSDTPTLAHHFRDAGYRTGYIGKWHLADKDVTGAVPPEQRGGYDYWLASNALEFTSDSYRTEMYDNDGNAVRLPGYRVDALTDAAIRFIDDRSQSSEAEPFYLFISYIEPHHQNHRDDYPAPRGYEERYRGGQWVPPDLAELGGTAHRQLPGYYGMVKRLDEAYGRLLDALESLDLRDDTIVLFTSDHGNHFKTRNGEYKRSLHDASIRVPTVLCGPGFDGGREIRELVSHVDLPPTLLDAAGLPVPPEMQGRSLLPLVRGHDPDWPDDVLVQISESQVGRAIRTTRWKYGVTAPDADPWHDAHADHYVESYLYDLHADPYELDNLIGRESHHPVAARMRERLTNRLTAAGEPPPTITAAESLPAGQRRVTPAEVAC